VSINLNGEVWTYSKLNVGREEINTLRLEQRALDERRCDDALLAIQSSQELVGELGGSIRHREGCAPGAILSLDDFITAILDPVHKFLPLLALETLTSRDLREERDNGDTAVSTDDRDVVVFRVSACNFGEEAGGANDIKGGHTEESLGVEGAGVLEDLGDDGDSRVDGVRDDEDVCLWCVLGDSESEVANDGGIGLEYTLNLIQMRVAYYYSR
jgi:hypothetical protein